MFTTRDGTPWEPNYLIEIEGERCIGCGRCFKVCAQDVMTLMAVNEEGELVACNDDDDDDEEFERKVMIITNAGNCIGCGACSRVCPKICQKFAPASALQAA
ncbi:MAG: ferredoxin III, nif-specific [Xanthobacteraceae bacterium]